MTRHKLSNECTPTLERDRSAEEFFEHFPEEYQRSRDVIRKLYETLKKLHEEKLAGESDAIELEVESCPEDALQAFGSIEARSCR